MNRPAQVLLGAKLPLRPMHVWAIRLRLQMARRSRDLALFDIALDSKLRGCDVVSLRYRTSVQLARSGGERSLFNRRLAVPFSLRSRTRRADHSQSG